MNYYKATSETLRLIKNLHELSGDMDFINTEGEGPFEGENLDGSSKCPNVHGVISEQLEGWMKISSFFLHHADYQFEQLAEARNNEQDAIDDLHRESEKRTKVIENLKRRIELKNKRIRELKGPRTKGKTFDVAGIH